MGSRNPDRIPFHQRRARCETVADMDAQGWDVISKCLTCGLMMQVDLKLIAKVSGPRTTLWNRRQGCRRLGCIGMVQFLARIPSLNSSHYPLETPDEPYIEQPAWKRGRDP